MDSPSPDSPTSGSDNGFSQVGMSASMSYDGITSPDTAVLAEALLEAQTRASDLHEEVGKYERLVASIVQHDEKFGSLLASGELDRSQVAHLDDEDWDTLQSFIYTRGDMRFGGNQGGEKIDIDGLSGGSNDLDSLEDEECIEDQESKSVAGSLELTNIDSASIPTLTVSVPPLPESVIASVSDISSSQSDANPGPATNPLSPSGIRATLSPSTSSSPRSPRFVPPTSPRSPFKIISTVASPRVSFTTSSPHAPSPTPPKPAPASPLASPPSPDSSLTTASGKLAAGPCTACSLFDFLQRKVEALQGRVYTLAGQVVSKWGCGWKQENGGGGEGGGWSTGSLVVALCVGMALQYAISRSEAQCGGGVRDSSSSAAQRMKLGAEAGKVVRDSVPPMKLTPEAAKVLCNYCEDVGIVGGVVMTTQKGEWWPW